VTEFLKAAELDDLLLGFAHGGRGRQCFGDGLATPLVCQTQVGSMTGIIGLRTVAVRAR